MNPDLSPAAFESVTARTERLQAAARQRTALHVPNRQLGTEWQRMIKRMYRGLLEDAAAAGEPLDVVLQARSSAALIRNGKYSVRHFETLALVNLLARLELHNLEHAGRAMPPEALLDEIETSLTRLDQAEAAHLPTQHKRRSRAARLKFHPQGWQAALIDGAPPKLKVGLLMLCLTGCRPRELEHGIEFALGHAASDVRLTLDIVGAKCDEYRGQPLRTFQFLIEDKRPMVTELIATLSDYQAKTSSSTFRLGAAMRRIRKRATQLWPDHAAIPSAYSFRYNFREHMALQGATRSEIARAMGHRSILSSLSYGNQVRRERSQQLVMDVSATFEPRYPAQHRDFAERWRDGYGATRLQARDVTCDVYPAQRL